MTDPRSSHAFFAYGTLMFPEVMLAVTGRSFVSAAAELSGYARRQLRGRIYPGVVAAPDARTEGRLYRGLDVSALEILDAFEGDFYERRSLPVRSGTASLEVWVYVIPHERRSLLVPEPWSPEAFAAEHLPAYLAACRGGSSPE